MSAIFDRRVRAAQVAHDNAQPAYASDEDEKLAAWMKACPVALSPQGEHDIHQAITRDAFRN